MNAKQKRDLYQEVTKAIIEKMENGVVPWAKPWNGQGAPKNYVSNKQYRGLNVFLLSMQGYKNSTWLTYKQAKTLGGQVKKGEKGTMVTFWKFNKYEDSNGKSKTVPFLKHYTVFNFEQCEGIKDKNLNDDGTIKELDFVPCEEADRIVEAWNDKPSISHKNGEGAFYRPSTDSVQLPTKEDFKSIEGYYGTLFHELGHSTGHITRLKREGIIDPAGFGSHKYSKEELVAEMTSSFMMEIVGLSSEDSIDQSAAYLKSWISVFKEQPKLLLQSAGQAQKAVDTILGTVFEQETKPAEAVTIEDTLKAS